MIHALHSLDHARLALSFRSGHYTYIEYLEELIKLLKREYPLNSYTIQDNEIRATMGGITYLTVTNGDDVVVGFIAE